MCDPSTTVTHGTLLPSITFMRRVALGCCIAIAAMTSGCIALVDRVTTGWLTIDWTIEQQRDGALCDRHGASTISITVEDEDRLPLTHATVPCRSFGATLRLDDGHYAASLVLLDADGRPISSTFSLSPIVIWRAQTTRVTIDFPAGSFDAH
jgi:hypothetical protein